MRNPTPHPFDLREILDLESLEAHYQPIVSVRKKEVVGYEGLTRGIRPLTQELIDPMDLFAEAGPKGMVLDLDRLCRKKVLENFRGIGAGEGRLLSLNFEASIIDQGVVGSGYLIGQVDSAGLKPQSIALEIIESNVRDAAQLQRFIQIHREYGFLIALDDVGAGHSNLNRIPLLRPDILKIDRYLIHNITEDFYKQEIFKSLVGLAHKIGALIIAEGVETEEEALFVTELGVDMMQGFYFHRPQRYDRVNDGEVETQMKHFPEQLKEALLRRMRTKRFNLRKYELMACKIQEELAGIGSLELDAQLGGLIRRFPNVECLYVLDGTGVQLSDTIFAEGQSEPRSRLMFRPGVKGSDHSMKDYYFMLMENGMGERTFVTEPYLSLATGTPCVTFARLFKNGSGKQSILCMDIKAQHLQNLHG